MKPEEIFTYFFAQYYAQEEYKDKFLKIAPISESKFDLPFDKLQDCFKAWDEDIVETNRKYQDNDEDVNYEKIENHKLPAIYLPQYKIGNYFIKEKEFKTNITNILTKIKKIIQSN